MIYCALDTSEFDEHRFDGAAYADRYARALAAKDRILSACGLSVQSPHDLTLPAMDVTANKPDGANHGDIGL